MTVVYAAEFQGIWSGMIGGTAVQTLILVYITAKCDWDEEVGGNA
jgi:Na+-driven multidrug efflux pump